MIPRHVWKYTVQTKSVHLGVGEHLFMQHTPSKPPQHSAVCVCVLMYLCIRSAPDCKSILIYGKW